MSFPERSIGSKIKSNIGVPDAIHPGDTSVAFFGAKNFAGIWNVLMSHQIDDEKHDLLSSP